MLRDPRDKWQLHEIVERRKPEKRTELLRNDFVARGTLIDDLHGRLVITVNNNSMVCSEVTPSLSNKNYS